jgi:hypothetical protein
LNRTSIYSTFFSLRFLGCRLVVSVVVGGVSESISMGSLLKPMSRSTRSKNEVGGEVNSVDSISDSAELGGCGGKVMSSSIVL